MVSVERLIEYANIDPETDNGDIKMVEKDWPQNGRITAKEASFRYNESLDNVLQKLTFTVKANEKVTFLKVII